MTSTKNLIVYNFIFFCVVNCVLFYLPEDHGSFRDQLYDIFLLFFFFYRLCVYLTLLNIAHFDCVHRDSSQDHGAAVYVHLQQRDLPSLPVIERGKGSRFRVLVISCHTTDVLE